MLKAHALLCGEEPPPDALNGFRVSTYWDSADRYEISLSWSDGTPPFSWSYEVRGPTTVKNSGTTSNNYYSGTYNMAYTSSQIRVIASVTDAKGAKLTWDKTQGV